MYRNVRVNLCTYYKVNVIFTCLFNLWKCKTKSFNFGYSGSTQFQASKIVYDSPPTNCCVYIYFLTDLFSVKICCAYGINEGLNQRCIEMLRSDYVHITRWTSFSPVYLDASTLVVIGYYSSCCRRRRIGKKGYCSLGKRVRKARAPCKT